MKPVKAGKFNRLITIQSKTRVEDGYGGAVDSWTDVCKMWASVEPLTGAELFAAMQSNSEIRYKVRIRYRNDIRPFMRVITNDGKVLEIVSVVDVEYAHRILELECKELVL